MHAARAPLFTVNNSLFVCCTIGNFHIYMVVLRNTDFLFCFHRINNEYNIHFLSSNIVTIARSRGGHQCRLQKEVPDESWHPILKRFCDSSLQISSLLLNLFGCLFFALHGYQKLDAQNDRRIFRSLHFVSVKIQWWPSHRAQLYQRLVMEQQLQILNGNRRVTDQLLRWGLSQYDYDSICKWK